MITVLIGTVATKESDWRCREAEAPQDRNFGCRRRPLIFSLWQVLDSTPIQMALPTTSLVVAI